MGVNAQTAVPEFQALEVLTAAEMTQVNTGIPVFATTVTRDAAFGGAGEKVLAEGQFAYIEATNTTQYYDGATWQTLGASGLSLIVKTAFTTTATWTLDNIFSSTYDNYRIDINWTQLTSTANYAGFQLRVGGTASTASYNYAMTESNNAGTTNRYATAQSYMPAVDSVGGGDAVIASSTFTVFKPNIAQVTSFNGQYIGYNGALRGTSAHGYHGLANSYDGVQIANGSTASGTVYVYGLAK
jgi:hypothetical protein